VKDTHRKDIKITKTKNIYTELTRLSRWVSSGVHRDGVVHARDKYGKWHTIPGKYFQAEFIELKFSWKIHENPH
jgi:hypothetical protein